MLPFFLAIALAQGPPEAPEPPPDPLVVAIKPSPPFTIPSPDGRWHGISYELWEAIAEQTDRPFELRELPLSEMLEGLASGEVDVGVAALTVTAEREAAFDFTHPFYQGGLGIAVSQAPSSASRIVWRVLSARFLQTIGALVAVLFVSGLLMWFFERKHTDDPKGVNSVFDAFWWSAVTMTTVGYGDRVPQTVGGRLVAMVWMFSGIILISSFTATISSVLTVSQLESDIDGPEDLSGVRVGTVASSTSAAWVADQRLYAELYDTPSDALAALARDEVEAVVYDAPVLQYLVHNDHPRALTVLPHVFARQNYAIGLRQGLPGLERINQVLLERVESPWFRDLQRRHLGG
jgi:ABC-type amino acid transport substrate-binding protein